LQQFKKKQRIESNKDAVQDLFRSMQVEIETLKAELSGKVAVAPVQAPSSPTSIEQPSPTQKPEETKATQNQQQHVYYRDQPPENPERVIELSTMTASLKAGVWTFSKRQQEALAFAEHVLAIKNEKTRELMVIKADGQRAIEKIKTEGARERAQLHRTSSRSNYPLDDNSPYGGCVEEYIR
jgi:hypothetical protein